MPTFFEKPINHRVRTKDGWDLLAVQYPHASAYHPVILVHGMGANRHHMDFPAADCSLAKYLQQEGFEVWLLELRGTQDSQPVSPWKRFCEAVRPTWIFDDHVFADIPAFVKKIQKITGHTSFHWVGHSLGGVLVYTAVGTLGSKVCQSAVTLGAAMNAQAKPGFARVLIRIEDRFLRWIPMIPNRYLSKLTAPLLPHLAPLLDNFYYSSKNMSRSKLKIACSKAIENISIPLFLQLHSWYKSNRFVSLNGHTNYHTRLKTIRSPWLVIAGSVDGMTPLPDVYYGYENLASDEKKFIVFGKEFGHHVDYGHIDLILGNHASREVYPEISGWFKQYDGAS